MSTIAERVHKAKKETVDLLALVTNEEDNLSEIYDFIKESVEAGSSLYQLQKDIEGADLALAGADLGSAIGAHFVKESIVYSDGSKPIPLESGD